MINHSNGESNYVQKNSKEDVTLPQAFTFNDEHQEIEIVDKEPPIPSVDEEVVQNDQAQIEEPSNKLAAVTKPLRPSKDPAQEKKEAKDPEEHKDRTVISTRRGRI